MSNGELILSFVGVWLITVGSLMTWVIWWTDVQSTAIFHEIDRQITRLETRILTLLQRGEDDDEAND